MFLKIFSISVVVLVLGVAAFVFLNNSLVKTRGQVVITDQDVISSGKFSLAELENTDVSIVDQSESQILPGDSSQESTRMLGDLSTVSTTMDGYGNRTETRVFKGDPRLRMVMVQTSVDGMKTAYVYAHLGGIKILTGKEAETALTLTADELAQTAEIYETRLDKERQKPRIARQRSLQPMESSEIEMNPVQVNRGVETSDDPEQD